MTLFQSMVLAINTSILAVVFAFSSWLYVSSKAEVEREVASGLQRAARMSDSLAAIKSRELSTLAQSLAASPMVRGALATSDAATIQDVLQTLAKKNGLDAVAVGGVRHRWLAGDPEALKTLAGKAAVQDSELSVGLAPTPALLDSWTAVTGVRYALHPAGRPPVTNLGESEAGAAGRWYEAPVKLLGGRLPGTLFAERAPFWTSFTARRNSLIVLGGALFFAGLVLSAVFAGLIEKHAAPRAESAVPDAVRELVLEIDRRRGKS